MKAKTINDIPSDYVDFLSWLREQTENAWETFVETPFETFKKNECGGLTYRTGTKWNKGLCDEEIDRLETRFQVKFPSDYRQFLCALNSPDRGCIAYGWNENPPYDLIQLEDEPSFFDWTSNIEEVQSALDWPLKGALESLEKNNLWPEVWGNQPEYNEEKMKKLGEISKSAPPLVPITGHRYLLADTLSEGNPVLSVWGSDIIIYAPDLRSFLIAEFSSMLGIHMEHRELHRHLFDGFDSSRVREVPFWGDLIFA